GGFASFILRNLPRTVVVNAFAFIVVVALTLGGNARAVLDERLSVRSAPMTAAMIWKEYSPEHSTTYKLRRSFQYGLNFYLHREISEWSPGKSSPVWVYAPGGEIQELRNRGLNCPFNALRYAVIVCKDSSLPGTLPDRRQPH
ncbi:MAG: hypothetical protein DME61_03285, partial [Verrucomicrobia bacterium]